MSEGHLHPSSPSSLLPLPSNCYLPLSSLSFLLLLSLSILFASPGCGAENHPPNILILMADDLGFGDVGFYGLRDDIITPTIDRLASEGVILRNFFTHPMCMPSRAAFVTGRYPWSWGMTREPRFFNIPSMPFLQQSFLQSGYNTSLIGKWDLLVRQNPDSSSFAGFRHYWHHSSATYFDATVSSNQGTLKVEELTTATGDEAVRFIKNQSNDVPFFLWFTPLTPHSPFHALASYVAQFNHVDDPVAKIYLALIKHFDDQIERIVRALEETGKRENTLIVFLSDNGGLANPVVEHGIYRQGKVLSYDGGLRVPAFFHWPSKLSPGIIRETLIIEDLYDTLHSAAGIPLKEGGAAPYRHDFWLLLIGPKDPMPVLPSRQLGEERQEGNTRDLVQDLCCYSAGIRKGRFKMVIESLECNITGTFIRNPSSLPYHQLVTDSAHEISIFDTFDDPGEKTNLYASMKGTDTEKALWDLYKAQAQPLTEV